MRIFELIFTTILFFSIILTFIIGQKIKLFIKRRYIMYSMYGSAVIFAILSICFEGFRFIMLPLYLLCLILCAIEVTRKLRLHTYQSNPTGENQTFIKKKSKKKHCFLRTFGIAIFCVAFLISIILSWFLPVNNLPTLSGNSKVGTVFMDFTNPSRTNILNGTKESQKIAVQIWYPASDIHGKKRVNWMINRKVASLFAERMRLPDILGQLCMVKTNSYLNASLSTGSEKYPIILFSGGGGMFNGQNVIQMEELASNGFVVAAVSHPKDDFATVYSNGTVLPYDKELGDALSSDMKQAINFMKSKYSSDDATPEMQRATIKAAKLSNMNVRLWAEDLSFIADQIEKMNNGLIDSIFKGKMDTSQFGVFGHSFGGAAAGQVCLNDDRFKAFMNIDGTPFGDTVNDTIDQPFMIVEADSDSSIKFKASDGYSPDQRNYLIVSVNGAEHMNFTDLNTIIPRIGKKIGVLGNIDTDEQTKIMNAYVLAFFNHYLKGSSEPILESKKSPFSEISPIQR